MLRTSFFYKKIIIVLDNITNKCTENAVEDLIKNVQPYSLKFVFVLGSIEKLSLPKSGNDKPKIEIIEFKVDDIDEYAKKCQKKLSPEVLKEICEGSNGLPIMVDLMISNDDHCNREFYNEYIDKIFYDLKREDSNLALVIVYIALLSLVNTEIEVSFLTNFDNRINTNMRVLKKINSYSLIKYNEFKKTIKMHDIIRDYITYNIVQFSYYEDIKRLLFFYEKGKNIQSCSIYSVLLKRRDLSSYKNLIIKCIDESIQKEQYMFLISFGNHYFRDGNQNIKDDMYYKIAHGFILALLSVGDYPTAKRFFDNEGILISYAVEMGQLDLAIQLADLFHLQSMYDTAIYWFQIILSKINGTSNCDRNFEMTIDMKIAHSFRHIGCYSDAIIYYFRALEIANSLNSSKLILTINLELTIIYMSNPHLFAKETRYQNLEEMFTETLALINKNNDNAAKLLYYRNHTRYLISNSTPGNIPTQAKGQLEQAFLGYEKLKKRLIYTMYFELGEYYRFMQEHNKAIDNYCKAIDFSHKNGDKNLETMSYIGIILTEYDAIKFIYNNCKNEQINLLIKTIKISREHNLTINEMLANLILTILKREPIDEEMLSYLEHNGLEKNAIAFKAETFNPLCLQLFMM